jgi:pilus assembly protein CpaB
MIARFALLFLGLLSGVLVAGAAFYSFLGPSSVPTPAEATARSPAPPAAMIAVASGTIPTGKLITPQDVRFAPQGEGGTFDGEFVRPQAPTPVDQAKADHDIVDKISGAVSRRKISSGDPILRTEIVKPGESGFLAAVLEPGKRAITIGVTAISGAAGLIYPGDRVDIILTQSFQGKENDPGGRSVSETIASDIRVLAIDQQLQANAQQHEGKLAQTVTVEVDPRQTEEIAVAAKLGDLSLTIRSVQPSVANVASEGPGPVWARDVSPASRSGAGKAGGAGGPTTPQVRVMHGEKAENVPVQ